MKQSACIVTGVKGVMSPLSPSERRQDRWGQYKQNETLNLKQLRKEKPGQCDECPSDVSYEKQLMINSTLPIRAVANEERHAGFCFAM